MSVLTRVRALLGSVPDSPRSAGFDPTALGRVRGDFTVEHVEDGYAVHSYRCWSADPAGPLVSSRRDDRMHAPVFDIDQPVTLTNDTGMTVLHTSEGDAVLPGPAHLVPSRTDGHFHLYLESVMTLRQSVRLAKRLRVVDPQHIRASQKTGAWIVRLPA